jgi:hypothetical protein
MSYTRHPSEYFQANSTVVQFIGRWFEKRFDSGRYRAKPGAEGQVLAGKLWLHGNFRLILEQPPNRTKFHWLDEKHLLNRDVEAERRADPLSGYIPSKSK